MTNSFPKYDLTLKVSLICLLLMLFIPAQGQKAYTEYELKAGYLVNLPKYIQWKEVPKNSISIGILGQSPFGDVLEKMTKQVVAKNQKWTIKYFLTIEQYNRCDVLFITKDYSLKLPELIPKLRGENVLTVADEIAGFCSQGGMINLTSGINGKPFEINVGAIKSGCLNVNLELLRLAVQKKSAKPDTPCQN